MTSSHVCFSGRLKLGGMCLVMCYVDNILVAAESERDIELVLNWSKGC